MAEMDSIFLLRCAVQMSQIRASVANHFTLWMERAVVLVFVPPEMQRLPFTTENGHVWKTEHCEGICIKVRDRYS